MYKLSGRKSGSGTTRKKKLLKIVLIFFFSLVILVILVVGVFLVHAKMVYKDFNDMAFRQFKIPEIDSGFVPQGLSYCENEGLFLISGYSNKNGSSTIFAVKPDGSYRKISIIGTDGGSFINHVGGVGVWGDFVYLAGCDGKCYVLDRDSVMDKSSEYARVIGSFDAYNNADFCYINNNQLYIGEYYYSLKYCTDSSHRLVSPDGDINNAIISMFELVSGKPFGAADTPDKIYSVPGAVQGICITENGEIVLSTSVFYNSSKLFFYNYDAVHSGQHESFSVNGVSVPLFFLDNQTLVRTIIAPPKSEGIDCYGNKVFVIFESASNRFVLGKFIGGEYVYGFEVQ